MFENDNYDGRFKKNRIILNVGGKRFEPYRSTLSNQPDMPLAWITHNKDRLDYDPETGEFFFDRHPMVFSQILNYFQTGKLHCPKGMCGPCFQDELSYWGIHERQMESCCWPGYTSYREAQENLKALDLQPKYNEAVDGINNNNTLESSHQHESLSFWNIYKPIVWEILDEPYSSITAKVYGWASLTFVVISVFVAALWTVSSFQKENESSSEYTNKPRLVLLVIEGICTAWFSAEFILRLVLCPSLTDFVLLYQNWIDLLAIIPAYFIILDFNSPVIDILTTLRILRIARYRKLLYDLHIIGKTFKASWNLFLLLLFLLLIPVIVCSSALFYTEKIYGESISKSQFTSIPASVWWGLVTVTTVGYGDLQVTSVAGKIFGVFCALCGVLLVAMSASIAGSTFALYYNLARTQMKLPKNRRKISVDCENLPTIIGHYNTVPTQPVSPNDSGCDHFSTSSDGGEQKKKFARAVGHNVDVQGHHDNDTLSLNSDVQSMEHSCIDHEK